MYAYQLKGIVTECKGSQCKENLKGRVLTDRQVAAELDGQGSIASSR
jgi:hypothetical protein